MSGALREAWANVRARRGRSLLGGLGIVLVATMLAVATTVSYGLLTGFDRGAAEADLPDVLVSFDSQPASAVRERLASLPDLEAFSLREQLTSVPVRAGRESADNGVVEVVGPGRRGYAIVAGHDVSRRGGVVIEQGLATDWGLGVGDRIRVYDSPPLPIVGLARAPDNVAYPLAAPHVYVSLAAYRAATRQRSARHVNLAQIWLKDPSQLDAVLVQARMNSYGLTGLSLITRSGVRVLIDQAAGIVIALLGALSLIALLTAATMLTAAARAEIQRRLHAIGIWRAIGASRGHVTRVAALEALLVAIPAAAIGVGIGALLAAGPSDRLLGLLNQPGPGSGLVAPLIGCFALTVLIPALAGAWPAWRAAGGPPLTLLRGAEMRGAPGRRGAANGGGGLLRLGVRLATTRRVRLLATLASLAICTSFILLMVALAAELNTLANDPSSLGRRYQLSASLPASAAPRVEALPGVSAVGPRWEVSAVDAYSLGEITYLIAFRGDHTQFEDPPLVEGSHLHGDHDAEVGRGLAQLLGLRVGSTLAVALADGHELRLRVGGIVSSLEHDGRIAYVPERALLRGEPDAPEKLAVIVSPGASTKTVTAELERIGAQVTTSTGVAGGGKTLVDALRGLLLTIAAVDGLVCLYMLTQALALTAGERRSAIAVLRACGAGARSIRVLLAGAALAVLVPAAVIAVALERFVLGPAVSRLAQGYASLSLAADAAEIAALLAGLAVIGALAVWWVVRRVTARPIAGGL
ncbi:MAG TPA: ABC transporter permease [Solirubrobacterales bacterium]|nr:ABC transporter permease [Solirubrobacterales bacterium]